MLEDDIEFEFVSSENLKQSSSNKEIFNQILQSYLDLVSEYEELHNQINNIQNKANINEKNIQDNVKDIREKIIKVAKMAHSKSNKMHSHSEFDTYNDKISKLDDLTYELESELKDLTNELEDINKNLDRKKSEIDRLINLNKKFREQLNILGKNYLKLNKKFEKHQKLQKLKNEALFKSSQMVKCSNCDSIIDIRKLDDIYCPSCDIEFCTIEKRMIFSDIIRSS